MTPAQLIALAKQIYPERGDNWKTPLACDLGVALRTVRRWVSGERSIPADLEFEMKAVAGRRSAAAIKRAARLREIAGE